MRLACSQDFQKGDYISVWKGWYFSLSYIQFYLTPSRPMWHQIGAKLSQMSTASTQQVPNIATLTSSWTESNIYYNEATYMIYVSVTCHCRNKSATEWLPWSQTSWRGSGYWKVWKTNCLR